MRNEEMAPIIIGKLLNIGGILQKNGNKMLLPYGLNQQQFSILFEIAKAKKVRQKDILNRMLLEKAHVSKVVRKLCNMGLVTITVSDLDKRSSWLEPTEKGKEMIDECSALFNDWNSEWSQEFDEDQFRSMLNDLSRLQAVFNNIVNGGNDED